MNSILYRLYVNTIPSPPPGQITKLKVALANMIAVRTSACIELTAMEVTMDKNKMSKQQKAI